METRRSRRTRKQPPEPHSHGGDASLPAAGFYAQITNISSKSVRKCKHVKNLHNYFDCRPTAKLRFEVPHAAGHSPEITVDLEYKNCFDIFEDDTQDTVLKVVMKGRKNFVSVYGYGHKPHHKTVIVYVDGHPFLYVHYGDFWRDKRKESPTENAPASKRVRPNELDALVFHSDGQPQLLPDTSIADSSTPEYADMDWILPPASPSSTDLMIDVQHDVDIEIASGHHIGGMPSAIAPEQRDFEALSVLGLIHSPNSPGTQEIAYNMEEEVNLTPVFDQYSPRWSSHSSSFQHHDDDQVDRDQGTISYATPFVEDHLGGVSQQVLFQSHDPQEQLSAPVQHDRDNQERDRFANLQAASPVTSIDDELPEAEADGVGDGAAQPDEPLKTPWRTMLVQKLGLALTPTTLLAFAICLAAIVIAVSTITGPGMAGSISAPFDSSMGSMKNTTTIAYNNDTNIDDECSAKLALPPLDPLSLDSFESAMQTCSPSPQMRKWYFRLMNTLSNETQSLKGISAKSPTSRYQAYKTMARIYSDIGCSTMKEYKTSHTKHAERMWELAHYSLLHALAIRNPIPAKHPERHLFPHTDFDPHVAIMHVHYLRHFMLNATHDSKLWTAPKKTLAAHAAKRAAHLASDLQEAYRKLFECRTDIAKQTANRIEGLVDASVDEAFKHMWSVSDDSDFLVRYFSFGHPFCQLNCWSDNWIQHPHSIAVLHSVDDCHVPLQHAVPRFNITIEFKKDIRVFVPISQTG